MSDGLISANQLKNDILGSIGKMTKIGVPITRDYLWGLINHAIEDAPTIDAVEVVRCKDCKHAETLVVDKLFTEGGKERFLLCNAWHAYINPSMYDYCSRGERKESEGEE